MKLTKAIVEGLELPAKGQTFVWDDTLKGFGVKLSPTARAYVVQGRVGKQTKRVVIGKHGVLTLAQARQKAQHVLAGFLDGVDPVSERRKNEALADRQKHLDKSSGDWKDKPVTTITRDRVATRHKELSKKSAAQADLAMRYLKSWLNHARARHRVDDKPILAENPVNVLNKGELRLCYPPESHWQH